jgi:hypothetical protein
MANMSIDGKSRGGTKSSTLAYLRHGEGTSVLSLGYMTVYTGNITQI